MPAVNLELLPVHFYISWRGRKPASPDRLHEEMDRTTLHRGYFKPILEHPQPSTEIHVAPCQFSIHHVRPLTRGATGHERQHAEIYAVFFLMHSTPSRSDTPINRPPLCSTVACHLSLSPLVFESRSAPELLTEELLHRRHPVKRGKLAR